MTNPIAIFLAAIIALLVIAFVFSLVTGSIFMAMFGFPWLWGILWIVLLVWFITWLFRGPRWHRYRYASPSEILKARYASGEITKKQYTEMMKDIEKG
jgi:uncharacterized membrane protein